MFRDKLHCTAIILENLGEPEWISVPCGDKVLTDIVCTAEVSSKQRKEPIKTYSFNKFTLNLFLCNNGDVISSARQCDGFNDCPNGEGDVNCLCCVDGKPLLNSSYCRYVCEYPRCSCSKLFFQNHKPGCNLYRKFEIDANSRAETRSEENFDKIKCPNELKYINRKQLDDLIPDYNLDTDAPILYELLT